MADGNAVEMRGLRVRRGTTQVFERVDLDIPRGQITGLMGPSGCGKTTLMRSIVGVQKIAGGTVTVLDDPAGTTAQRRRVAYDTQAASVYGDLTIRQNLGYFARLIGAPASDVDRVIDQVGLRDQARQTIDSLSGGQESRVSLAVAMLGKPRTARPRRADRRPRPASPFRAVDDLPRLGGAGATIIVSSHVMDEALRCDRLILMRGGRIISDTTPDRLLSETGQADPDAAFLALIERDAAAPPDAHPRTRRGRAWRGRAQRRKRAQLRNRAQTPTRAGSRTPRGLGSERRAHRRDGGASPPPAQP